MTMHDDAFDELASAYLDGEVGVDERATIEADTELLGRVEEFRGLRTLMLSNFAGDGVNDDLLSAALGAFDDEQSTSTFAPPTSDATANTSIDAPSAPVGLPSAPVVRSLDEARRKRSRAVYGWLGAAAAAGIIAVGVTSLGSGSDVAQDAESKSASADAAPAAESNQADAELSIESAAPEASNAAAAEPAAPANSTLSEEIGTIDGPAVAESAAPAATEAPTESVSTESAAPAVPSDESGLIDIDSQEELASQATVAVAGGASNTRVGNLISCPELGAEAVSEILWQGRQAFILLRPSAADPREAIAVSNNCEILATTAL
jgi:hypothetical protein